MLFKGKKPMTWILFTFFYIQDIAGKKNILSFKLMLVTVVIDDIIIIPTASWKLSGLPASESLLF